MTQSLSDQVMVGILNWNQKDTTLACLASLQKVQEPKLKIVLVDNASVDGSFQAIQRRYPVVDLIINKSNRGCAGGRNDLLNYFLKSDLNYLMFLDNDAFLSPNCFHRLLEDVHRYEDTGVVGVKTYYHDRPNVFWNRGGAVLNPWCGRFEKTGHQEVDRGQYDQAEEVDSVCGGFTFLTRAAAERVPKIDERYFIYFEDSDWCFNVRKSGLKVVSSAKAKAYHKASSSVGLESAIFYYYRTRNQLLFIVKNTPLYTIPFTMGYCFLFQFPKTLLRLFLSKQHKQMKGMLLGIFDFFRRRWFVCTHESIF